MDAQLLEKLSSGKIEYLNASPGRTDGQEGLVMVEVPGGQRGAHSDHERTRMKGGQQTDEHKLERILQIISLIATLQRARLPGVRRGQDEVAKCERRKGHVSHLRPRRLRFLVERLDLPNENPARAEDQSDPLFRHGTSGHGEDPAVFRDPESIRLTEVFVNELVVLSRAGEPSEVVCKERLGARGGFCGHFAGALLRSQGQGSVFVEAEKGISLANADNFNERRSSSLRRNDPHRLIDLQVENKNLSTVQQDQMMSSRLVEFELQAGCRFSMGRISGKSPGHDRGRGGGRGG